MPRKMYAMRLDPVLVAEFDASLNGASRSSAIEGLLRDSLSRHPAAVVNTKPARVNTPADSERPQRTGDPSNRGHRHSKDRALSGGVGFECKCGAKKIGNGEWSDG